MQVRVLYKCARPKHWDHGGELGATGRRGPLRWTGRSAWTARVCGGRDAAHVQVAVVVASRDRELASLAAAGRALLAVREELGPVRASAAGQDASGRALLRGPGAPRRMETHASLPSCVSCVTRQPQARRGQAHAWCECECPCVPRTPFMSSLSAFSRAANCAALRSNSCAVASSLSTGGLCTDRTAGRWVRSPAHTHGPRLPACLPAAPPALRTRSWPEPAPSARAARPARAAACGWPRAAPASASAARPSLSR